VKVLIADDHPIFRTSLRQVLTEIASDVSVVEAGDFKEAIDIIAKNKDFDLALVDLMMPG
jgi:CheY-like chemotaxis protein